MTKWAAIAIGCILLGVAGVLILGGIHINHLQREQVKLQVDKPASLPTTGCVIVAEVNDCKIYNCTYKSPNTEGLYIIKELVVCQTSNACMTVVDRRRPP